MYRTLYFRYSGQKKHEEIEKMLYDGALKLFDKEQGGSGSDLSKLYLENLVAGETKPSDEIMHKVVRLYSSIPTNLPDKDVFLSQALKWSTDKSNPSGNPRLHQLLAYEFWKVKRYPESRHHFLYSLDGSGCGHMLAEFHSERGYVREVDLFIVGTVLQYLCLRKHIAAAVALKAYSESHPSLGKGPPYKHPLINFVWLLLLAIEHKQSVAAFTTLIEKYKPSLKRDPTFLDYLDKIGQHFFGVPPPQRAPPGGMFSGIFDSLMSAFNDDDGEDDDAEQVTPSTSSRVGTQKSTKTNKKMTSEDLD